MHPLQRTETEHTPGSVRAAPGGSGHVHDSDTAEPLPPLRIQLLGGFHVSLGSRAVEDSAWRLGKARSLVQLLALSHGHKLHREQVMDLFWPDLAPKAAAGNFYQVVHAARRALATISPPSNDLADAIHLRHQIIAMDPPVPLRIDIEAFQEVAAGARRTRNPVTYHRAIDLYTGDLLPEHPYDDWLARDRQHLREQIWTLLIEFGQLLEEIGDYPASLAIYRRAGALEPAREQAHVGVMRMAALLGDRRQALDQYAALQAVLRDELGAMPNATTLQLYEDILAGRFPSTGTASTSGRLITQCDTGRHNLPVPLTSFVGREHAVAGIAQLIAQRRFVTLAGEGGSGKTRLALAVGEALLDSFPEGVWLIELVSLTDPTLLPQVVASMLNVHEEGGRNLTHMLINALRHRKVLVILDNCEHLIDACAALVASLLGSCPDVHILTTSREALRIPGEFVWRVPALTIPDVRQFPDLDDLANVDAVKLFTDRAILVQPSFRLTRNNAAAVAEICARLEGLPLSIELAAARLRALPPDQLVRRLDDALRILAAPNRAVVARHRSLRATIDWSYTLLSSREQALLRRIAVCTGGWTLDAAEVIATGSETRVEDTLEILTQLTEKSLIQVDPSDEAGRYRMLATIRQYAWERLVAHGELEQVRQRHAQYFLDAVAPVDAALRGSKQVITMQWMEKERDNLRGAMRWLLESQQVLLALQMGCRLARFWALHGSISEGCRHLEQVLEMPGASDHTREHITVLFWIGRMAYLRGDYDAARAWSEQCLLRAADARDLEYIGSARTQLGHIAWRQGDLPVAQMHHQESLRIRRELGDLWHIAISLRSLGYLELNAGNVTAARPLIEESLDLFRELGDSNEIGHCMFLLGQIAYLNEDYAAAWAWQNESMARWQHMRDWLGIVRSLSELGYVAIAKGNEVRAGELFKESFCLYRDVGSYQGIADCLEGFAVLAAGRQPERAMRLAGAASALRSDIGELPYTVQRVRLNRLLDPATAMLPESQRKMLWSQGRAMTLEQAIEYAGLATPV